MHRFPRQEASEDNASSLRARSTAVRSHEKGTFVGRNRLPNTLRTLYGALSLSLSTRRGHWCLALLGERDEDPGGFRPSRTPRYLPTYLITASLPIVSPAPLLP
ncbi:hypothetical protein GQ53DRAFT_741388 [Thozetella sp. PMI_491]|nr:hypothetical protein GQ53DRAFT_741388 [Thozetella sp. PMI_491]